VIVVEDDAETCRLVRSALAPELAVTAIGASPAALAQGAALAPDLVVAGAAPALRIRMEQGLREVPFLLVTDPGDGDARAEILHRAAQDYVIRPLCPAEIRVRARNLVAAKRARDLLRGDLDLDRDAVDLEALARAASLRRRELAEALEAARHAQHRAERQSRTKTAYLRTVGHEIATPLASLREGLRRLREPSPLAAVPAAAGHAASVQAIEASLEWIAELGQAIREVARGEQEG
jgi:DNA-binding response OmpR family regulator